MKKIGDPLRNDFGSPGTISQKTGLNARLMRHPQKEALEHYYVCY